MKHLRKLHIKRLLRNMKLKLNYGFMHCVMNLVRIYFCVLAEKILSKKATFKRKDERLKIFHYLYIKFGLSRLLSR